MKLVQTIFRNISSSSNQRCLLQTMIPHQSQIDMSHIFSMKNSFRFSSQKLVKEDGKSELIQAYKKIQFQNGKDLFSTGSVIETTIDQDGNVSIMLQLDQNYRKVKSLLQTSLITIPWIKSLDIKMAPKESEKKFAKRGGLEKVKQIIAVSSCQGGVGQSTVAVNLAFSLHQLGYKVGIFDADVYGPSLPTLIAKENAILQAPEDKPKEILPVEFEGVKTMSYGYVGQSKRAIMRGPMVSAIVNQLAYQTQWGDIDYLIVDMPPGTGDIQITLCQELQFDGAVIVTTPQQLAFVDVVKGIEMFDDLKVPTFSVVENMSQFSCEQCDHINKPFGPGYLQLLKNQFGIKNSISIPIFGHIARFSDAGSPVVMTLPDEHTVVKLFAELAKGVHQEVVKPTKIQPIIRYQTGASLVIIEQDKKVIQKIKSSVLRQNCGCAACIDEFSGKKLIKEETISQDVFPYQIQPQGNYAVAIIWSDGHQSSIYPYETLLSSQIPANE